MAAFDVVQPDIQALGLSGHNLEMDKALIVAGNFVAQVGKRACARAQVQVVLRTDMEELVQLQFLDQTQIQFGSDCRTNSVGHNDPSCFRAVSCNR
jgi:uncharacterized protein YejL (UPF0352 family)